MPHPFNIFSHKILNYERRVYTPLKFTLRLEGRESLPSRRRGNFSDFVWICLSLLETDKARLRKCFERGRSAGRGRRTERLVSVSPRRDDELVPSLSVIHPSI